MNKLKTKEIFKKNKIPTPDYITVLTVQSITEIIRKVEKLGLPVVVKPVSNGSSVGVSIIKEYDDLQRGINYAGRYGEEILIEKYIKGRELTVGILNDKPLPVIEIRYAGSDTIKQTGITSGFYDYNAKYKDKRTQYITLKADNYSSSESLFHSTYINSQELAICAHDSLGCHGFSRVDMILGNDDEIYILEVNTIPGLTERSLLPKAASAINIDFTELCNFIIDTAHMTRPALSPSQQYISGQAVRQSDCILTGTGNSDDGQICSGGNGLVAGWEQVVQPDNQEIKIASVMPTQSL